MAHTAYPAYTDVQVLLSNLTNPIVLGSNFDGSSQVNAAIAEWERRTRYRPFFQSDTTDQVTYTLDPPGVDKRGTRIGGAWILRLPTGLLTCQSVAIGVNQADDDSGDLLTLYQDYWLEPSTAPNVGEPFTQIRFGVVQRGLPQSIQVTGVWGYCSGTIPDDAWLGILNLAAAAVLAEVREGISAGWITITDVDQSQSYSPQLIAKMSDALNRRADRVLYRYRLLS
jgi:hypothetical protein